MPRKWSREIVVCHILERHRGGQRLNSGYVQVHVKPLYQAGREYFGSWRNAIEAAGLQYDDVRVIEPVCPKWNREKIIAVIRRLNRLKQPLNSFYIQKNDLHLFAAASRYFGGWGQAIEAARLNYSKLRILKPARSWSKSAVVTEILRRVKNGLSIRGNDVCRENQGLYVAARRHFGKCGWAKARVIAGFDPIDPCPFKIWDEQSVREEIVRLYESGVPLNTGSLQKSPYAYILAAGCKYFGTWARAIRAAGLNYSRIRKGRKPGWWTKPRILMCIKSLERRGIRLSHDDIRKSHGALLGAALTYFGSWSKAVEAAGIPYRQHCRIWSTTAWLRRMSEEEYDAALVRAQTHARKRRLT